MKRGIITINGKTVSLTESGNRTGNENGNGIWMTAWEIAELFDVTVSAVNSAVKAICKSDVLNDYEVCRYIKLDNGLSADVYSLEIIIPVAFRLNTYHAHLFRRWLMDKATAKERQTAYMVFVQHGKGGFC
jgi:hypothetical protein